MDRAASHRQAAPSHEEILILEDSKPQADKLTEMLTRKGYRVSAAKDGLEGLSMLMESKPHLIISDVWMPKLNGYDFCRTVKEDKDFDDLPIILLTDLSDPHNIIKGLNAGADYYVTKPYNESLLLSMVESIVAARKSNGGGNGKQDFEITARGKTAKISARPQQIVNFLFSTYENLVSQNDKLTQARHELKSVNDHLEERIREKTLSLEEEVVERNKANEALKRTLNQTVDALARAVEMRDPYTAGHQRRVAEISFDIARELGLSEDLQEGIRVIGFLHDIGKIIIPAEILTKPSRLSDYEFVFIKEHPGAGYDILKEIEFPWPVAMGVLQHHERLNGSGYPLGLHGDQIILEAKILAVADVAESMASHRPYRPALGIEAALEELVGHRGVLYDPDVVDALLNALKGNDGIFSKLRSE